MDKKQRSALGRFRRVQEFLTTNRVEGTQVKLQVLEQVIREMTTKGEEKDASDRATRGATARQRVLRDALWNHHMVPISQIARRAFSVPEVRVKFDLPLKRADNEAILASASGIAQTAEVHAAVFTQEGLSPEFVAQMRAAIAELSEAVGAKVISKRRRKTSRENLDALVKRGVGAVVVLDAIVKPKLESQPDLLAAWLSVRRPFDTASGGRAVVEPDITPAVKVA